MVFIFDDVFETTYNNKFNFKILFFDYRKGIDYNPFGGGIKPDGIWVFNYEKAYAAIVLLTLIGLLTCK